MHLGSWVIEMIDKNFWVNKRVLITGHTGFKGSWLCLWLSYMGAKVTGYALDPPTSPNLFTLGNVKSMVTSINSDIRDKSRLCQAIVNTEPDIVFHMAAQPLVREAYCNPIETYETNVMGTVYLLDAIRYAIEKGKNIKAVINVTTDKCYDNKEWTWGYREIDRLGGYDPYSNSKACSELVTTSYRNSFFNPNNYNQHGVAVASARAGNVIGGGDWANDRLVPDCMRALLKKEKIKIRNPNSIRPWQHVLEPLSGYLQLAQRLFQYGIKYSGGWNFGPDDSDAKPVEWIVKEIIKRWGEEAGYELGGSLHPHEANYLKLDCSKAKSELGWKPNWDLEQAIDKIIEWTKAYHDNQNMALICLRQIEEYLNIERKDELHD